MVYKELIGKMNEITFSAIQGPEHEPECVKKLVRGDIPSCAGIGSQFFSTLVFALIYTLVLGEHVLYHLLDILDNSEISLGDFKDIVRAFLSHGFKASKFLGYVLDPNIETFGDEIVERLDKVEDKNDLRAVLAAYFSYLNMMHWWLHVRFPWGLGCAFRKVSGHM